MGFRVPGRSLILFQDFFTMGVTVGNSVGVCLCVWVNGSLHRSLEFKPLNNSKP